MSVGRVFQVSIAALGAAAVAVGGMIFLFGPAFTGDVFASGLSLVTPMPRPVQLGGVDVDSEMRFYAVLWVAYGLVLIRVSQSLPQRMLLAQAMLGVFFVGGLGRVLSALAFGLPHPLFQVLMWIELAVPLLLAPLSMERVEI